MSQTNNANAARETGINYIQHSCPKCHRANGEASVGAVVECRCGENYKVTNAGAATTAQNEYSEFGPIWQVVPITRDEELGSRTSYLVVDMDYDTKNFCGFCIAECGSLDSANAVRRALNQAHQTARAKI